MHPQDTADIAGRFWSRSTRPSPDACWLWQGYLYPNGYGYVSTQGHGRAWSLYAHRVAWILTHGAIPAGLCILHRCDVRHCVNPAHLFLGTKRDNTRDMLAKGRMPLGAQVHLGRRAKLTPEQVRDIRQRAASGTVMQKVLAVEYGVDRSTISHIVRGDYWRHL